ncbi:hypothetical protein VPH35_102294 [Triticum aestivum]
MLRLHKYVLTQLLPSSSASAISPLSRLISAAAPAVSPNPSFAVEEYLVSTCGLTRPQAAKASAKLSHLKSPANPDAVLAFSPASASPTPMSQLSLPRTPSSSAPASREPWPPSSSGSPASASRVLRSHASSRSPAKNSAADLSPRSYPTSCPSSDPTTTSSGYSSTALISSDATSTRLSSPTSPSSWSAG